MYPQKVKMKTFFKIKLWVKSKVKKNKNMKLDSSLKIYVLKNKVIYNSLFLS